MFATHVDISNNPIPKLRCATQNYVRISKFTGLPVLKMSGDDQTSELHTRLDQQIHSFSIHNQNRAGCNKSVDILQQICCQQADTRMRSHALRQLVDDKSVASCQQVENL